MKGLFLQMNARAVFAQFPGVEICFENSKAHLASQSRALRHRPPPSTMDETRLVLVQPFFNRGQIFIELALRSQNAGTFGVQRQFRRA
jgi:hypothetical protein